MTDHLDAAPQSKTEKILFAVILAVAAAGLWWGWRVFWFLTDDAFISFRYISNSMLGYGYVWNAPPFLPVEGYTSFLWIVLLDGVWRLFGVEPPDSANVISLAFSFATLVVCARMLLKMRWTERLQKYRMAFVTLLFVFLLLNRTFLAWTSSGLETAMFDFLLLSWVYVWVFYKSPMWKAGVGSLLTSLMTLSRPDGLLFTAATIFMIALLVFVESDRDRRRKILLWGVLPLLIAAGHEGWRLWFYGEWLPNTYYAKYMGPWPEMGAFYFLSFVLEYAVWAPILIGIVALVEVASRQLGALRKSPPPASLATLKQFISSYGFLICTISALFGQFFYYTFMIGGDHFEFRVYCQFLPLIFIALAWSVDRLNMKPAAALSTAIVFIALSMPVQWTHWHVTKDFKRTWQVPNLNRTIAQTWPAWARPYAALFDRAQGTMIPHAVGMRYHEHKEFWHYITNLCVPRSEGMKLSREGNPVCSTACVGVYAWTLPNVAIIDTLGLNDYVVARNPIPPGQFRAMAHSRSAPANYVKTYRPNVWVISKDGKPALEIQQRKVPMSDEMIRGLEISWRDRIREIAGAK